MNKQTRYQQRCIAEGRCPHCGKPCAPYRECVERRSYKQISYWLRRWIALGMVRKVEGRGMYEKVSEVPTNKHRCEFYTIKDGDVRKLPRLGKKYIDITSILEQILRDNGKPMSDVDLVKEVECAVMRMKGIQSAD